MSDRPELFLVVAVAANGVIGRDGDMPWRLPTDLAHFKAQTLGRPMIMGRRTFQSIGRALPGRVTIVVTRDPGFAAADVTVVASFEAALAEANRVAAARGVDAVAVVGGGEIYAQALPYADRIELTEVAATPPVEGAVRFPALDPADWVETARTAAVRGPRDTAEVTFVTLVRRRSAEFVHHGGSDDRNSRPAR